MYGTPDYPTFFHFAKKTETQKPTYSHARQAGGEQRTTTVVPE